MTENLVYRKMCLIMEVQTSIKLLKKGMGDLQKISSANDFYHAPILLLSTGYERLIKCLLCLALMDENGDFKKPPYETSRGQGHNLDYLIDKLLSLCAEKNYSAKFSAAKADIDFLSKDKDLKKIIAGICRSQASTFHKKPKQKPSKMILENCNISQNI